MKKVSSSHHSSLNELNITPLLDLAFVLLVIFIITTPQLTNDLEMNLPTPKKDQPQTPPPKVNRLVIDEMGRITLNDETMELERLQKVLVAMKASDGNASVVVKGADNVNYQNVILVLDALQQAEISNVGLATDGL